MSRPVDLLMLYSVLAITAFAVCFLPFGGIFYLSTLTCSWPPESSPHPTVLRALVLSDAHILGDYRSTLDQVWTDWSLQTSFAMIRQRFQPDIVLNIGDILDEGSRSTKREYRSYLKRAQKIFLLRSRSSSSKAKNPTAPTSFSTALSTGTLPQYTTVGNHDIGWRFLNDQRLRTYERDHHPSNEFFELHNLTFARINSMALHPDADYMGQGQRHRREIDAMLANRTHVDVLLTHQPLYRSNDVQCGAERQQDSQQGGTTYYPASQTLREDDDVVNQDYTQRILEQWTPTTVLSGHLHSACRFTHPGGFKELTIPTFSWRMRPDPKYFLIAFQSNGEMAATQCDLPHEHMVFVVGALWLVVCAVLARRDWNRNTHIKVK